MITKSRQKEAEALSVPKKRSLFSTILASLGILLVFLSFLLFFSANWYIKTYGELGFGAILSTLFGNMTGVDKGLVRDYLQSALVPSVILTPIIIFILFFLPKFAKGLGKFLNKKTASVISAVLSLGLLGSAAATSGLFEYLGNLSYETTIYEDEYVDSASVNITFPEQKRNLVFIFLESMETTYADIASGGAMENNLIPNLHRLASENINFSHNDSVGGGHAASGSTWTMGALVAQSSGVPLSSGIYGERYYESGSFLSGVTSLGDILNANGYSQALMVGSMASFAGRDKYYSDHKTDYIYDYHTAITDEIIEDGYFVWWGMEDKFLYTYAKDKLLEMASGDKPFAFSMLTVDTHFANGYVCSECKNDYERQYDNVITCADRQVADFVEWLKAQDFYENTTVIIVGDHNTMDNAYIKETVADDYERHVYNVILNAPEDLDTTYCKNRSFTTMDIFPTTLAAIGCQIEGERLGLGVNLFSGEKTLAEQYGIDTLNRELNSYSSFYITELLGLNESIITICNGKTISFAIPHESGRYLLPMRGIVEAFGGKVEWNAEAVEITLNGKSYFLKSSSVGDYATISWTENGKTLSREFAKDYVSDANYIDEQLFSEIFGLKIKYDLDNNKIIITK